MTTADKSAPSPALHKQTSSWRSSLYEEPTWVTLAWIVIPVAFASVAIFFAMR
jgi:hypothetical protein